MVTCIPRASGVPALSGPPNWWDVPLGAPQYYNKIDDPRWRGSLSITHPDGFSGTGEDAAFRALYYDVGGTNLYLSWYVKVDPGGINQGQDALYVGFNQSGTNNAMVVRIVINTNALTQAGGGSVLIPDIFVKDAGGVWRDQPDPLPAWLTDKVRVWVNNTTPFNLPWAVNMVVPLNVNLQAGSNVTLANNFKMWFEHWIQAPVVVHYKWPRTAPDITTTIDPVTSLDVYHFPALADWDNFQIGVGGGGCIGGISLESNKIGTTNVDAMGNSAPHLIIIDETPPTDPVTNTFFAKPRNGSTTNSVLAHQVKANFRIANWGSLPDWNDVPNPETLWTSIVPGPLPDNAAVIPPYDPGNMNPDHNLGEIQFNWTMSAADQTPYLNGTKRRHQCMLVELSGSGLVFTTSSVYRNMTFDNASVLVREADISIQGLEAIRPVNRDVYLYVETANMPPIIPEAYLRWWKREPRRGRTAGPTVAAGENEPIPPDADTDFHELDKSMPTYKIHVYHDTGRTVTVKGITYPVVRSQSSFGHYVRHQGPLYGWQHLISAPANAQLQQVAPNFYKVVVPNDGKIVVTNTITAIEKPGCLGFLLAIFYWLRNLLGG